MVNKIVSIVMIDDDVSTTKIINEILKNYFDNIEIYGIADNVDDGIKLIEKTKPDLVILDIMLPDGTAFDIIERTIHDFLFIVITSYTQFALKAFEFSAVHYLLKPIDEDDFILAIKRFYKYNNDAEKMINQTFKNNFIKEKPQIIFLPSNSGDGKIPYPINKIIRIQSQGAYTKIFFSDQNQPVVVTKPLQFYETILKDLNFVRLHNEHILNIYFIKKIIKGKHSKVIVDSEDEFEISIPELRKEFFFDFINKFAKIV
jgi:two-component system LytT family response regulator